MNIGLTSAQIEQLQNGESVEVTVAGLHHAGQNATLTIEPEDDSV